MNNFNVYFQRNKLSLTLKLIHRPSLTNDEVEEYSDYEYYHAEKLGKEGAPCDQVFKECETSILDMFGGIYTPFFDGI